MKIKTLQWNIGGGWIREEKSDATKSASYSNYDLNYIVTILKSQMPDVITLQETHYNKHLNQTEVIANKLGYKYFVNDTYDNSHIDKDFKLGQAIISKYEITEHDFEFYYNPKLKVVYEGDKWITHDKGATTCLIRIKDSIVEFKSTHSTPFEKFKVDYSNPKVQKVIRTMEKYLSPKENTCIIQGDFNADKRSLKKTFPGLFADEKLDEIKQESATTPKNSRYDHVLYKNVINLNTRVIADVLTDHFPIVSEFEI